MRSSHIVYCLAALAVLFPQALVHAQESGTRPRVFLDCNAPNCDRQYFRTEINWVNWVNDREVADIHIIVGSVSTSGGGREYQLDVLDAHSEEDEGYEEQLLYSQLGTDTNRETLDGLTHTLGLGLAAWANAHGYRGLVTLQGPDPELGGLGTRRLVSQEEVDDPWDLWIFSVNGNVNRSSEETRGTTNVFGSFNASRVTPTWKLNFNTFVRHERLRRTLSAGDTTFITTDWTFRQLVAYSVADHWSIGITGSVGRQTDRNRRVLVEATPSLEYSFFPYDEATRRSLTAFYTIGPAYSDYFEETELRETEELRYQQALEIQFDSRQTWGDAGFTIRVSHYLHDIDLNNRTLEGRVSYRIARGIEVNANGNIAWEGDQIYLPLEDASDEETLLNLQRRRTDRSSSIGVGLRLQFGSIFNNVVNNRFRNVGGFRGGGGGFRGGGRGGPF